MIEIIEGFYGFEIFDSKILGGGGGIRGSASASRPRSSANKVQANSLLKLYFSCYIIQSFTEIFKAGKIGMGFFGS